MSDTGLTQEQVDSMLSEEVESGGGARQADPAALADFERETMGNLGSVLNALTGFEYRLASIECAKTNPAEITSLLSGDVVFSCPLTMGETLTSFLAIDPALAKAAASKLTGGEPAEDGLNETELSAVSEVVAQANGTYLTNLSTALDIEITGENVSPIDAETVAGLIDESAMVTTLHLEQGESETTLVRHLLPGALVGRILQGIAGGGDVPAAEPPPEAKETPTAFEAEPVGVQEDPAPPRAPQAEPPPTEVAAATYPTPSVPRPSSGSVVSGTTEFSPAAFSQLIATSTETETRNLDILLDVPLQVTVELGKTHTPIKQILEYGQGSLITLDKLAGEPVDLLVNGKYFAKGEVVVIDENFGVRITSILSPAERIAQLV